jgi:hypothetical protein
MQFPLSAWAGFEQRAKSDRICGTALLPGVPHRSGLDTMTCSLMAKSAYRLLAIMHIGRGICPEENVRTQAPAHNGVAFALLNPHGCLEAWTMKLQSTVVV